MISFLVFPLRFLYYLFLPRISTAVYLALAKKEIEILKRKKGNKRLVIFSFDKLYIIMLHLLADIKERIIIVKPDTLLSWQRHIIRLFWTFKSRKKIGRPVTPLGTCLLILQIKNENIFMGCGKIRGELLKLGISLNETTIRNILRDFRRRGMVRKSPSWRKFISMHAHSIFAMDHFTIDTLTNVRFYVHFIIHHESRRIVQFAITCNPTREFVRQQIILFSNNINRDIYPSVYLIHDRAPEFDLDYGSFNISGVKTSVKAPNMNVFAERFIGSIRREALDYFILVSESQIKRILSEYINYYNTKRPHQGINQNIPSGHLPQSCGSVRSTPVLGGLCHHYFRRVA